MTVPCNSWVIVDRASGKTVMETYQKPLTYYVNLDKYEVLPAYEWLAHFNREVRLTSRTRAG